MSAAAGVLPPALAKEIRALLPTYAAALGSIAIGCVSSSYLLIALGLLGFAFGSVALGAQSFGLEYSHRTLGLLLSQPIDRRRVFFYKLAVLSVMLVTLTVAILVLYDDLLRRAASPHTEPSMLMLAAACGLFVAPTLTMICRSTLAGIVFTVAIPGLLSVGADVVGALRYGLENAAAIDRFRLLVFWRGMLVICALGAVAGWRMFMRLEVIEGHTHLQFPGSLTGDVATRRRGAGPAALGMGAREERASRPADGVRRRGALRTGHGRADVARRVESGGDETASRLDRHAVHRRARDPRRLFGKRQRTSVWNARVADPSATYRHGSSGRSKSLWSGALGLLLGIGLPALMGAFESSPEIL